MIKKIKDFIEDVNKERKKVLFPKKHELIGSTSVVLIFVIIVAFILGIIDTVLLKIVQALIG
ncbi:SecE subunit of protein translocation complex [Candidatus Magnetoovum chiemensis]|nr:SecE subunit of protein translocation complex [Candidatus Magnetoovum chiemensis]